MTNTSSTEQISPSPPAPHEDAGDGRMGLTARAIALDLVQQVLRRGRALDKSLASHAALAELESRDRNFVRLLISTLLRRLGQIDALVDHCLDTPLPAKSVAVRDILRLGACQLAFLGTPPHAAVDQMVSLADQAGQTRLKGLVNAVLRRIARDGARLVEAQDAPRLNTPDWLWQAWSRAYGGHMCRAIAAAHLEEAPLDLTVRKDPALWAELLSATVLPTGSLRRPAGGMVPDLKGYDEGAWWVQDAAAAMPVSLFGDVAGQTVIDLCAAPGGKTAQLAAAGAHVIAVARWVGRLRGLESNLRRLDLAAENVCADAALWRPRTPAHMVLLDAPCTATGTIRRHPDIPYLKGPEDVRRMSALQARLLEAAVHMTAPGGLLVYAVCSLQPEEGPDQIAALLDTDAPVERARIAPAEIGGLDKIITKDGDIRTLPCHLPTRGGLDGFFVCRLRRL